MVISIAMLLLSFSYAAAPAKDKIRIGWVTSLSGPYASGVPGTYGMVYDLWIEEVNAKGGIYVKEYGKRLPLEVIKYDDKSDVGTMTKLLEKTILEDKVDLIFAPWGTAMLYAAAPIATKHKIYCLEIREALSNLKRSLIKCPHFFSVLNMADTQIASLAGILSEVKVKKAAIIYIQDLHGIESRDRALIELKQRGIQIAFAKSFPFGTKDLTPLLKEAKAADVDAFLAFVYPDESFLLTGQAIELGYNPKVFFMTVGLFFLRSTNKRLARRPLRVLWAEAPGMKRFLLEQKSSVMHS